MITVQQLPDSPPLFVKLYCSGCGAEYSANRQDYFLLDPNEELRCECDFHFPLRIVTKQTVFNHDRGQLWLQMIPKGELAMHYFYRCGCCESYHPAQFAGDCRDDNNRFDADELDSRYGWNRWTEIEMSDADDYPVSDAA